MRKTRPSAFTFVSLAIATLLLSSCASPVEVAETSKPESEITQSPPPSEVVTRVAGDYISYESFVTSGDKYSDSKVVLFFNAPWCSTCKVARDNFESSLADIPDNLTVVVVYFANAFELRKKYGVTVQHTFVEIDRAGEALGKWSGSTTYAEIVKNLA
jgi:thiol-disulfide isomerase/thioredoxin